MCVTIMKTVPTRRGPSIWRGLALYNWWRYRAVATALAIFVGTVSLLVHDVPLNAPAKYLVVTALILGTIALLPAMLGGDADLATKESAFPRFLLTLPVRTESLVGVVMLTGCAAIAALWIVSAKLILEPMGVAVPLLMPALALGAIIAWAQMLAWIPMPMRYGRCTLGITTLPAVVEAGVALATRTIGAGVGIVIEIALMALAYTVSIVAVRSVRRGDVWNVRSEGAKDLAGQDQAYSGAIPLTEGVSFSTRAQAAAKGSPLAPPRFTTAAQALVWYEWRRSGALLAIMCGLVFLLMLPLAFVRETVQLGGLPSWSHGILGVRVGIWTSALLTLAALPPLLALFPAGFERGTPGNGPLRGMSFAATRPVSATMFVAARLKVALLSVLAAWAISGTAVAVAMTFPARNGSHHGELGAFLLLYIAPQLRPLALVGVALLVTLSCKFQMDTVFIELCEDSRLAYGYCALSVAILIVSSLAIASELAGGHQTFARIQSAAQGPILIAAVVKLAAGASVVRQLVSRGLVKWSSIYRIGGLWILGYGFLLAVLVAVVPHAIASPLTLAAGAILMMPLVRVGLAPLVWDRSRHC